MAADNEVVIYIPDAKAPRFVFYAPAFSTMAEIDRVKRAGFELLCEEKAFIILPHGWRMDFGKRLGPYDDDPIGDETV